MSTDELEKQQEQRRRMKEAIKKWRIELMNKDKTEYTPQELADKLGIPYHTYLPLSKGERLPNSENGIRLATAIPDLWDILEIGDESTRKLLVAIAKLPEKDREEIKAAVFHRLEANSAAPTPNGTTPA